MYFPAMGKAVVSMMISDADETGIDGLHPDRFPPHSAAPEEPRKPGHALQTGLTTGARVAVRHRETHVPHLLFGIRDIRPLHPQTSAVVEHPPDPWATHFYR